MQTYCLNCKKHTDDTGSKKVIMTNIVVRKWWKCANCVAENLRILNQKPHRKSNKKDNLNKINPL